MIVSVDLEFSATFMPRVELLRFSHDFEVDTMLADLPLDAGSFVSSLPSIPARDCISFHGACGERPCHDTVYYSIYLLYSNFVLRVLPQSAIRTYIILYKYLYYVYVIYV